MTTQPTILIKKADGSMARVSLDEFRKKYQVNKPADNLKADLPEEIKMEEEIGNRETEKLEIGNWKLENGKPVLSLPKDLPLEIQPAEEITKRTTENNPAAAVPMIEGETHLTSSAPVKEIFADEAAARYLAVKIADNLKARPLPPAPAASAKKQEEKDNLASGKKFEVWNDEDRRSLLEEEGFGSEFANAAAKKPAQDDFLNKILPKLNFAIAKELQPRLYYIILSRVNGVRDDGQFFSYLVNEQSKGGLGLNEEQAKRLAEAVKEAFNLSADRRRLAKRVRKIEKQGSKKYENKITEEEEEQKPEIRSIESENQRLSSEKAGYHHDPRRQGRQIMHDATLPQSAPQTERIEEKEEEKDIIGPIDELAAFSLHDFHRLSANAKEAGELLWKKFLVLKQESYLLFIKAKQAWQTSPLFRQYQDSIETALKSGQKIEPMLVSGGPGERLRIGEFKAIVILNKHLY
ncbi:MAG: hypothetical protein WC862_05365 [Patescibacteria group bacterium]